MTRTAFPGFFSFHRKGDPAALAASSAPVAIALVAAGLAAGCGSARALADGPTGAGAPPPVVIEHESAGSVAHIDHPERFPVTVAESYEARSSLKVTGQVMPDVARQVPVMSLASGRAIDVRVRIGDEVKAGQLLMTIRSPDISGAYSDYGHAVADEVLAKAQLERSKALYERGAIAQKDLEVAQDTEDKALVDLRTTKQHLHELGADAARPPSDILSVYAPITGVITEQNITSASGVKTMDNAPNLFTISDLSHVWVVCDVYENDLPKVHIGDSADVRLNAYPDRKLTGRVSNILPVLDPNLRTAKVRIQVANPGIMKFGMFATATFKGQTIETRALVPATAIVHMHDRDFVYVPKGTDGFDRVEVVGGETVSNGLDETHLGTLGRLNSEVAANEPQPVRQEVLSGIKPGDRLVSNALALENTIDQ
jgi:cobalt-zinc-cadmium efflux system membrane fusion protein